MSERIARVTATAGGGPPLLSRGCPIRIGFIIGTLDRGGAEGQLVQLATRLDRRRFEPWVCCLTGSGPHREALEAAGVPVEILGWERPRNWRIPLGLPWRLLRLVRVIRSRRPDIVHGFLFWGYVLGAASAWVTRVPIVVASRRSLGLFKADRPVWLFVERLANRVTDCVVANSDAVRLDVLRQEHLTPDKVCIIHNGVDQTCDDGGVQRPSVEDLGIDGRSPVIAVVSNVIHYKGFEFLLNALPSIAAEFPKLAVLVAGDGPMKTHYEERARAMGLAPFVRWLGTRDDVSGILGRADVFVHPSTQEGFSNAVLEAMAAAKPVVATAVGGNAEAIVDRQTGWLVPARDPAALTQAIAWMLRHPVEAKAMGEAGRDRVSRVFSVETMVREYSSLYERLAAERLNPAHRPDARAV